MAERRTIQIGEDTEITLWGILQFVGIMLLAAVTTGLLGAAL